MNFSCALLMSFPASVISAPSMLNITKISAHEMSLEIYHWELSLFSFMFDQLQSNINQKAKQRKSVEWNRTGGYWMVLMQQPWL